jgi:hypothetical protein
VLNNKYMRELSICLLNPIAAELKSMEGDFVLYLVGLDNVDKSPPCDIVVKCHLILDSK